MNTIDTKTYGRKAEATKKVLGKMAKIALAAGALGAAGYAGREVVQGFRSQGHLNDLLDSSAKGVNASLEGLSKAFKFDKEGYEKSKAEAKSHFEDAKEHGDTLEKIDSNKYQSGALRKVGANIANILNSKKSAIAGNEVNKYGNDPSYLPKEAKNGLKDLADGIKNSHVELVKEEHNNFSMKVIYDKQTRQFARSQYVPKYAGDRSKSLEQGHQIGKDLNAVSNALAKNEVAAKKAMNIKNNLPKSTADLSEEHIEQLAKAAQQAKNIREGNAKITASDSVEMGRQEAARAKLPAMKAQQAVNKKLAQESGESMEDIRDAAGKKFVEKKANTGGAVGRLLNKSEAIKNQRLEMAEDKWDKLRKQLGR